MNVICRDLSRMDYKECWALQQQLFSLLLDAKRGTTARPVPSAHARFLYPDGQVQTLAVGERTEVAPLGETARTLVDDFGIRMNDDDFAGAILLVEHPAVYTLGKSGDEHNLLVPLAQLKEEGAEYFHIDRGGDITFHGPGQIVCYPILDLEKLGTGLKSYINILEEAVIRTVARFGIEAHRVEHASGVWVGQKTGPDCKICAIGVRASRYITMHGFALNVSTDLRRFAKINPCGFVDRGVTSVERECAAAVDMQAVKNAVVEFLSEELDVKIYK